VLYTYRNAAGLTREVSASMNRPPPHRITFDRSGNWKNAALSRSRAKPDVFERVYEPPLVHVRWQHESWKKNGQPAGSKA